MARTGRETRERARAAFVELVRLGENPTVQRIREIIGGGGTELLQSVVQEMKKELRGKMFQIANRDDVPADVVDQIVRIWELANTRADERFAALRKELESKVKALESQLAQALQKIDQFEVKVADLNQQLAARSGEVAALKTAAGHMEGRLTGLQTSLREREEEVDRVRKDAEARVLRAETQSNEKVALAEERYRGLETRLLNNFDQEKTGLNTRIEQLTTLNGKQAEQLEIVGAELESVKIALATAEGRNQVLEKDLKALQQPRRKSWERGNTKRKLRKE